MSARCHTVLGALFALLLGVLTPCAAWAEEGSPAQAGVGEAHGGDVAAGNAGGAVPDAPASSALPDAPARPVARRRLDDFNPAIPEEPKLGHDVDKATQQAYEGALQAYYAYRQRGYEQRLDAFAWQAFSSKVIFFVVLVLVFAGICFAAIQFSAGMRARGGQESLDTEFAVDVKGLRVRSPVLGVVVLAISLVFFYLYLVYVYPIVNVF